MTLQALQANPRELANSITHGIGLALSVVGSIMLLAEAAGHSDPWRLLGCTVFALALVAVYAASTLSHVFHHPPQNRLFRILDQGFIYLLIAGTYTPFALAFLRTGWCWVLFAVIWAIALAGFFSKIVLLHRIDGVSISACVVLGWLPITTVGKLLAEAPAACLGWILLGGVAYTLGTLFLRWDHKGTYYHAIWHLFVIAGSTCHYIAIFKYVAPQSV